MKSELTKDKYLALALVMVLLAAYVYTSDTVVQNLLVMATGGLLALLRSGTTTTAIGGSGAPAVELNTEPAVEAIWKAVQKKAAKKETT